MKKNRKDLKSHLKSFTIDIVLKSINLILILNIIVKIRQI